MIFAAIIEYKQDKDKIAEIRPSHRQYLRTLLDNGQLAGSGPFTDDSGALILYIADSSEGTEQLLKGDPFCREGIFLSWKIRPWNPVMLNQAAFPA